MLPPGDDTLTVAAGGVLRIVLDQPSDTIWEYHRSMLIRFDSKVGTFTQALYDKAKKDGWTVISMKNDWKKVFGFESE